MVNLDKVVSDYLRMPVLEKLKSYQLGVKIRTNLEEGLINIKESPIHLDKAMINLAFDATKLYLATEK